MKSCFIAWWILNGIKISNGRYSLKTIISYWARDGSADKRTCVKTTSLSLKTPVLTTPTTFPFPSPSGDASPIVSLCTDLFRPLLIGCWWRSIPAATTKCVFLTTGVNTRFMNLPFQEHEVKRGLNQSSLYILLASSFAVLSTCASATSRAF